jgi:hypothetical protein
MTLIENAGFIVSQAAQGLFQQHKYSNGYITVDDSEIAEANIVIHAASTFLQAGMDVWAESPFKTHESNKCKHLDLLVDLVPIDPEGSTILTIEAKRIAVGEEDKKVEEILKDYERIRTWRSLGPHQMPLFYGAVHPIVWFYGCLIVVFPEACEAKGAPIENPFSVWWKERTARPSGYNHDGIARLEEVLNSALVCDSIRSGYIDGERRMAVAYALFDFGPGPGSYPLAAHEAAHAVVAWRLRVPLQGIGLAPDGELRGGVACDWESLRGQLSDRETCVQGFAIAYAGAIQDFRTEDEDGLSFSEIFNDLPTDANMVTYTRSLLNTWNGAPDGTDTRAESSEGYQHAVEIVGEEQNRIERLATHLLDVVSMDQAAIIAWFAQDVAQRSNVRNSQTTMEDGDA